MIEVEFKFMCENKRCNIVTTVLPPPAPQRQTVPVAPRTRPTSEEVKSAIRFVQEQLQGLIAPEGQHGQCQHYMNYNLLTFTQSNWGKENKLFELPPSQRTIAYVEPLICDTS